VSALEDLDTEIELAIHARLLGWSGLSTLAAYRSTKAIFTRFPVPEDAPDEYVFVGPPIAASESGGKNLAGRAIVRDVTSVTLATGDPTRVNALASAVRSALRRWQPDLAGLARVIVAEPSGPIANDGDGTYGRVVSMRFVVHGA